ncbi:hypothetical protein KY289_003369 [Solanum tuberosum]|nr:hypothetical protein KY289_003369 [Solanum tuberosum]
MAHGHMIPTLDMAKLVVSRGVKATIITTPLNQSVFSKAIQRNKQEGNEIDIRLIKFQAVENGLPEGCERLDLIPTDELLNNFTMATTMMKEPFEQLLQECRPSCLVSDMFLPWTYDSAAKFNIPRLLFHGTSYFALCVTDSVTRYKPFMNVSSDSDAFVIPNLPHQIKLTRTQLTPFDRIEEEKDMSPMIKELRESGLKGYGVIFNSFYELEPDYVEYYANVLSRKTWAIGPLSLCNRDIEDKAERGKNSSIDKHECMKWLDSKKSSSIVYVCFGSVAIFTASQMEELAMGIEASGQEFIWVVRPDNEECLPEGFEERTKEKGLIIRGWAPQLLILDHEAVGAFVTIVVGIRPLKEYQLGCQWSHGPCLESNSTTKIQWKRIDSEGVKREAITEAIKKVIVGEEAEGFRSRAQAYTKMARQAVEEGGSSYTGLTDLLQDISAYSSTSN